MSRRAPALARGALDDLADDLPSDLLRDTKLLVSELITHRVIRRPLDPAATDGDESVALAVFLTPRGVRVQVRYDERGSVRPYPAEAEPTLGWQFHIVAELADRWGIERDGLTTVWFELDR